MQDAEFDKFFDALDKNANRTRTIFYFFVVISLSLFSFSLNSFLYFFPKERLSVFEQIVSQCSDMHYSGIKTVDCDNYSSKLPIGISANKDQHDLNIERMKHYEDSYIDEIAQARKYTFPFFGITSDIDYFFVTASLTGILSLFVLSAALSNESELFFYLTEANSSNKMRLRLLLTTQSLISPADYKGAIVSGIYPFLKSMITFFIIAIPIIDLCLRLIYDFRVTDMLGGAVHSLDISHVAHDIVDDAKSRPAIGWISLLVIAASIAIEVSLLLYIVKVISSIASKYKEARSSLVKDGGAPPTLVQHGSGD